MLESGQNAPVLRQECLFVDSGVVLSQHSGITLSHQRPPTAA